MSAPNTNLEKQKRRHRAPLIGMVVVVAFALTALFYLLMTTADQGTPVESGEGSIDGRTGRPSETAPTAVTPAPVPENPPVQP